MKDEHNYGKKMARNGRTKVIYKGTFVSIQTLCLFFLTDFPGPTFIHCPTSIPDPRVGSLKESGGAPSISVL